MNILRFFFNFPSQQSSQKAVSTGISPRGTVVDVYAAQTHTDHVTDWENSLKQIGPWINFLLTWRHKNFLSWFEDNEIATNRIAAIDLNFSQS